MENIRFSTLQIELRYFAILEQCTLYENWVCVGDLVSSKSVKIIIESDTNVRMISARMLNNYMTED